MKTTAVITCMTEGEFPFVGDAVQSVVQQTCPCEILLMVDERNTTIEGILGELAAQVKIIRVPLQPPGLVRNIGVKLATTEWIAFLDGDDVWMPDKIERQMAFAEKTQSTAIGARHVLMREDRAAYFYAATRFQPFPSSFFVTRELLLREPFSDLMVWEDAELWKRLKPVARVAIMRDFLIHYRVRKNSLSSNVSPAKRRKYFFAQLAGVPGVRFGLLFASWLMAAFRAPG